jgi:hypothetical protein
MFWHRGAIHMQFTITNVYRLNTLMQVHNTSTEILEISKFLNLNWLVQSYNTVDTKRL